MPYTIYAKMKRMGRQRKEELMPVRFELEKKPDTVRELFNDPGAKGSGCLGEGFLRAAGRK